ncbi:MAG TPA: hypothetical protein VFO63_15695 [Blastocatellia bacterium]|nr:hypothetical protein [Blastocatellia bacterium]
MTFKSVMTSSMLLLLISLSATAQSPPDDKDKKDREAAEKKESVEKKVLALVDETVKEIASLRLADNRIRMFALAGDVLWEKDEKRARVLFKQAMSGFADIPEPAAPGSSDHLAITQNMSLMQYRAQLRQEVVQMIARRDAKLARDFLRETKRAPMNPGGYDEELQWELSLASQIATTEPKQALQIAEESLEKGLSHELIGLYFKLKPKEGEAAEKLLSGIMKMLKSTDLAEDPMSAGFAFALLQAAFHPESQGSNEAESRTAAKTAKPVMDERSLRELIDMLTLAALREKSDSQDSEDDYEDEEYPMLLMQLQAVMGDLEKYAPARAAALKKKMSDLKIRIRPENKALQELEEVVGSGDVETLVKAAAKTPEEFRDQVYQHAAMKALEEGDTDRARQIINEHIPEPRRATLLVDVEQRSVLREAERGKLGEAKTLLSHVPPEGRAALLVQAAAAVIGKGDNKVVIELLEEARSLFGAQAANSIELQTLLEIARTYAKVEPVRSFEIIESVVDQFNTLIAAAAILDGFEYWRYFREGELMAQAGGVMLSLVFQCAKDATELARMDFDRAKAVADRFQRAEVRLIARLYVAQGVLSAKLAAPAAIQQRSSFVFMR